MPMCFIFFFYPQFPKFRGILLFFSYIHKKHFCNYTVDTIIYELPTPPNRNEEFITLQLLKVLTGCNPQLSCQPSLGIASTDENYTAFQGNPHPK